MNNKKVGVVVLVGSLLLLGIFIYLFQSLNNDIVALGCYEDPACLKIERSISVVHFAFGIFGFLLALAFYLLFFSTGDEAIVKRLEADTNKKLADESFSILLKGLDEFEKEVVKAVKEQNGITQNTLRLRTNMSKAKLSQVLSTLEKKGLIKREQNKKTLAVYLRE